MFECAGAEISLEEDKRYRTRVILEAEKMIEVVLLSRLHDRSIVHCFGDKILLATGGHRKAFACPA